MLLLAALAVVATAYSPALGGGFVWDDLDLVVHEPAVHAIRPLTYLSTGFWRAGPALAGEGPYYRPLTTLTYALDWAAGGGAAAQFHLTNVLLHLAACALVYAVARRSGAGAVAAALAAALFGLLPRLTESVAWIAGRTDVLAATFTLAALWLHGSAPGAARARWAAAGCLLLGLLSKEVAIAGLVALATWEVLHARSERAGAARALRNLAPAGGALAAYLALRLHATSGIASARGTGRGTVTALHAAGQYVVMLADPFRPELRMALLGRPDLLRTALGAALLALALAAGIAAVRGMIPPRMAGALALVAAALLPVLHLVPLRVDVIAADRFLYLPAAGLAVAGALTAPARATLRRVAGAACVLALVACGWATYRRSAEWSDEVALWSDTAARADPRDPLPENELGNALYRRGAHQEALSHYRLAAARGGPLAATAVGNQANALSELGRLDEARSLLEDALRREPSLPLHWLNLGIMLARQLDFEGAERALRQARALVPAYPEADRALGIVRGARTAWTALPPPSAGDSSATRAARARVYYRLGRVSDARRLFEEVARRPDATPDERGEAETFLGGHPAQPQASQATAR